MKVLMISFLQSLAVEMAKVAFTEYALGLINALVTQDLLMIRLVHAQFHYAQWPALMEADVRYGIFELLH